MFDLELLKNSSVGGFDVLHEFANDPAPCTLHLMSIIYNVCPHLPCLAEGPYIIFWSSFPPHGLEFMDLYNSTS